MVRGALHDRVTFERRGPQRLLEKVPGRQKTGSAEAPQQEQGHADRPEGASTLQSLESASQTLRLFQLLFITKVNFRMEETPIHTHISIYIVRTVWLWAF